MSKTKLAILGAGGHTRSLINIIDPDIYELIGIFDDSFDPQLEEEIFGIKVIGTLTDIPDNCELLISYGDLKRRFEIYKKFEKQKANSNLAHKSSLIHPYVSLGKSNQIFSNVVINSGAHIGDFNILNTSCTIEHEVKIGNYNHISVGSIICGRTQIGNHCFIGAGATIIDKLSICDNVIIGANSVAVSDIDEPGTYVGNPIRKIK